MKAISRRLDRFCYNHPNFGIPNLMLYVAIGSTIVFALDQFTNGLATAWLAFYPSLIFQGQVWRLVTFIFVPINRSMLWFVLSTYLYYSLGITLEQRWGTAKFSVFYGLGVLLTMVYGIAAHFLLGQPPMLELATMHYVNMSLFLSFATLFPDARFLLYFIIPVKGKWLAWISIFFLCFDIGSYFVQGLWVWGMLPVVALLNYLIFFWEDLTASFSRNTARAAHQVNPQTINFKQAQKEVQQRKGYLHKCTVCGVTDADNPDMEFRYCSKCSGYYCYCMDHIRNHTHVE